MSVTAKELSKKLGLSQTAVSMALNNKPGVSTETRSKVLKAAQQYGYDFTKLKTSHHGVIYIVSYITNNAILSYTPIFDELWDGIRNELQRNDYPSRMIQVFEKTDDLDNILDDMKVADCSGIILIGTEIHIDVCRRFQSLSVPLVLLDSYFDRLRCSSVLINNSQGAYLAADYLISRFHVQPGYLRSSYSIINFQERSSGFYKAIRDNGMSPNRCIFHVLSPSIEDAMADMLDIIDSGDQLARCYFADNDIIAIGAMKAFKLRGFKIPDDVAFVGFDNIQESQIIEPGLTTLDVPRYFMGETAARTMVEQILNHSAYFKKVEVTTHLLKRFST